MKKLKISIAFIMVTLFTGCELQEPSQGYKTFVGEYGSSSRYYCDNETGFFMKEYWWQDTNKVSSTDVVINDLEQPVRCGDTKIEVKETTEAYTGEL